MLVEAAKGMVAAGNNITEIVEYLEEMKKHIKICLLYTSTLDKENQWSAKIEDLANGLYAIEEIGATQRVSYIVNGEKESEMCIRDRYEFMSAASLPKEKYELW